MNNWIKESYDQHKGDRFNSFDEFSDEVWSHPRRSEVFPKSKKQSAFRTTLYQDGKRASCREGLLDLLAEVLDVKPSLIAAIRTTGDSSRAKLEFDYCQYVPPLDLQLEDPPPGIPPAVFRHETWSKGGVWWHAPSGSDRTLVGRWLESRGIEFRTVFSTSDVEHIRKAKGNGPIFIEIHEDDGELLAALDKLVSSERPVCVAAPFDRHGRTFETVEGPERWLKSDKRKKRWLESQGKDHEWEAVQSAKPDKWIKAFCEWIDDRMVADTGWDKTAAIAFMKNRHEIETLGDAFWIAGLIISKGVTWLEANQPREWVEITINTVKIGPAWVPTKGGYLLIHAVRQAIETDDQSLELGGLRRDRWQELLSSREPMEEREWFMEKAEELAAKGDGPVGDFIRSKTPKGGRERLKGLEKAGLLGGASKRGRLVLTQGWMLRALSHQFVSEALDDSVSKWGNLLLHPDTEKLVVKSLQQDIKVGNLDRIESACRDASLAQLPTVFALEMCIRVAGAAKLDGHELGEALASKLLDAHGELRQESGEPGLYPYPFLEAELENPLATAGGWAMSMLVLFKESNRGPPPAIVKQATSGFEKIPSEGKGRQCLGQSPWSEERTRRAFMLGAEIFKERNSDREATPLEATPLEAPAEVVNMVKQERAVTAAWNRLPHDPVAVEMVFELGEKEQITTSDIIHAVLTSYCEKDPEHQAAIDKLFLAERLIPKIVRNLRTEHLAVLVRLGWKEFQLLPKTLHADLLKACHSSGDKQVAQTLWQHCPLSARESLKVPANYGPLQIELLYALPDEKEEQAIIKVLTSSPGTANNAIAVEVVSWAYERILNREDRWRTFWPVVAAWLPVLQRRT